MKITREFTVARPVETVWAFFQDVPEVAQCLPGAQLMSDDGGGNYTGKVSVKLGPLSATFDGKAQVSSDQATRSGTINGKGTDRRGGSRGSVKVLYTLEPDGLNTAVDIDADVTLAGAAAQFGRGGLITEMSNRLIGEFVGCVEGKLAATTVQEAQQITAGEVKGGSLFWASLLAWLKRLFGRSGSSA
jgi:carbon monoxide dehydrogenase subunit G